MTGVDLADRVEGIVHEPTQVRDDAVDLTLSRVFRVDGPGRVDFGGGELEPADLAALESTRRNPDDDYGWWHLDGEGCVIEFNETLSGSERVVLQTRTELAERGAFHPTLVVSDLPRVPLSLAGEVKLKENARVSTIVQLSGTV